MITPIGFQIDSPAWPLVQAHISYWGITDAAGAATGTTVVCGALANEPSYTGLAVKLLDGAAAGQVKPIATHPAGTNTLTAADPFTDNTGAVVQVTAGTRFVILSALAGGGATPVSPSIGLWMFGVCDPGMAASQTVVVCPNLAGFPDDIFNNEFWMQVIHNDNAPGTAPEREIRRITDYAGTPGTFTLDAFTANVEANDLVAIFHESIMSIEVLGFGTLDNSSATVPADSTRAEGDNYFNGCLLMTTEGAVRFQPRRIVDYTGVGGIFHIDPNNAFTAVTGLVDYIIIGDQTEFVPAADGANNYTPSDVIGNKTDTAVYAPDNASSIVRYIKGLVNRVSQIWTVVTALLTTTETGGSLTTDGNVQDLYINNAPAGVFEPLNLMLDLTNMAAADTIQVRLYYRINPAGNLIMKDSVDFVGVQAVPLKNISLEPNRHGVQVTIQRTAGADHAYDWSVCYRA